MKRSIALGLLALALPFAATAQELQLPPIIDGSGDALTAAERGAITWAVAKDFRDPLSAQYMNLRRGKQEANFKAWCGSVNAKNAYGAYTGFVPFSFIIKDGVPSVWISEHDPGHVKLMRQVQASTGC